MSRWDRAHALSDHFRLGEFFVRGPEVLDEVSWAYVQKQSAAYQDAILINLARLSSRLEKIRGILGKPLVITSGYRCPTINQQVGGAPNSYHVKGMAADLQLSKAEQKRVKLIDWQGGYGKAKTWCHLDIRPYVARWEYA